MSAEAPDTPAGIPLSHYLKTLKLTTFLREYQKLAHQCTTEGVGVKQFVPSDHLIKVIARSMRHTCRRRSSVSRRGEPTHACLNQKDVYAFRIPWARTLGKIA